MSTKEAYKLKVEAELELGKAKLAELKARLKNSSADARLKYAELSDDLELKYEAAKLKLAEFGDAGEDTWEKLKGGVETAWTDLKQSIHKATS